jgi:hypothetical protein
MNAKFGDLRDFICRECGLYGMVDVMGMEFEYDQSTGILYDIITTPTGGAGAIRSCATADANASTCSCSPRWANERHAADTKSGRDAGTRPCVAQGRLTVGLVPTMGYWHEGT